MMRRRAVRAGLVVAALSLTMAAPAAGHGNNSDADTDLTGLPVGTPSTEAGAGNLWSCTTQFNENAPGAETEGPWFNGDDTWDATKKYTVEGSVEWDNAVFTITKSGGQRIVSTNNLPTLHPTGEFPIASDSQAYEVDRNPSSITEQDYAFELDATPTLADEPACLPMGAIGILKSGVLLFDPTDAGGRDAVAYEVQDACDGHPNPSGYHYHSVSDCVLDEVDSGSGHSKIVGWAFDGFGIYGNRGQGGSELLGVDLDECHGHTHKVKFDGKKQKIYHYHATVDYPYVVGCFRGDAAVSVSLAGGGEGAGAGGGALGGPTGGPPAP